MTQVNDNSHSGKHLTYEMHINFEVSMDLDYSNRKITRILRWSTQTICNAFKSRTVRTIKDRKKHPNYVKEFGRLEGDTIIGRNHRSVIIILVKRKSKYIITIKQTGRQATDIKTSLLNS